MPQSPKIEIHTKQSSETDGSDINANNEMNSSGNMFTFSAPQAVDMRQNSMQAPQQEPQTAHSERHRNDNYFHNNKGNTISVLHGSSFNSPIISQPLSSVNRSNSLEIKKPLNAKSIVLPNNNNISENIVKKTTQISLPINNHSVISLSSICDPKNLKLYSKTINTNTVESVNQNHSSASIINYSNINENVKLNTINSQIIIPSVMSCSKASGASINTSSSNQGGGIIVLTQASLADLLNTNTLTRTEAMNVTDRENKKLTQQILMINPANMNTNIQVTGSSSTATTPTSLVTTNQILSGPKSIMLAVNNNQQTVRNFTLCRHICCN